jgi:uncharacterized protein (TIGR03437 family)
VIFGDADVEPSYAGVAIGFPGLYQVKVVVPEGLSGAIPLRLAADGIESPAAVLATAP